MIKVHEKLIIEMHVKYIKDKFRWVNDSNHDCDHDVYSCNKCNKYVHEDFGSMKSREDHICYNDQHETKEKV
jgi:hypothetical protein